VSDTKILPFFYRSFSKSVFGLVCLLTTLPCSAESLVFYVASGGAGNQSGTSPESASASLAKVLALIPANGGTIHITAGQFDEPTITLPAHVVVSGNWDRDFKTQNPFTTRVLESVGPEDDLCKKYTCITTSQADRTLTINKAGAKISQVVVLGPSTKPLSGSSYSVIVDGVDASLDHVVIKAGQGATGAGGAAGQAGHGYCSRGGAGGDARLAYDGSGSFHYCAPSKGGNGDSFPAGARTAKGGEGGDWGNTSCRWNPTLNHATDGHPGGAGDQGIEGVPSTAAATDKGLFGRNGDKLQWKGASALLHGDAGTPGGGGGGGGPGGSWNSYIALCIWNDTVGLVLGGRGHMGSRGGCGGGGGGAGQPGGSAFALVVNGGKVSAGNLVLFGGQGGHGGIGGDGAAGSLGEVDNTIGATGGKVSCGGQHPKAGTGGPGGAGGKGGGGGGGSGGSGGHAFTLVKVGTGDLVMQGGVFRSAGGKAGSGGVGGKGADSKTVAPTGAEGLHETSITLDLK
jgi:hypothetical protein